MSHDYLEKMTLQNAEKRQSIEIKWFSILYLKLTRAEIKFNIKTRNDSKIEWKTHSPNAGSKLF
jgi:hypothetical protein